MKVLITGASGFVGQSLVPVLIARGHQVLVLLRSNSTAEQFSWVNQVTQIQGDLLDKPSLLSACEGCDAVIHLASLAHITNTRPEDHWTVSYTGSEHLLDAAIASEVSRLIFISSIKASSLKHASAYAQVKIAIENKLIEADQQGLIDCTILRPAVVYGVGMKGNLSSWIRKVLLGKVPGLPTSSASLSMISVEDLALAISHALETPLQYKGPIAVDDGQLYSLRELEQQIHQVCQSSGPSLSLPRICWWLAGKFGDVSYNLTGKSIGFSSHSYRTLFCVDEKVDKHISELTGFEATQQFSGQLTDIVSELKKSAYAEKA